MADAAVARLEEVAGPDLYRCNAFRVTGIATDADRSTVRQRRQMVVPVIAAGADIDLGHGMLVTEPQVRAAFEVLLGDSRRRLADEVFWLWGEAEQPCGCLPQVHREHDAAVRAHSAVLDAEADSEPKAGQVADLWSIAVWHWRLVLQRADFWEHLRYRVRALDDRALDVSTVDALRDAIPVALVKPLVGLALSARDPARLVELARDWPAPDRVVDDLLDQATEPLYRRLSTVVDAAFDLFDKREFDAAASHVERLALTDLKRLEQIVPAARFRRTRTLCDQTAVLFNNCALAMIERQDDTQLDRARGWLVTARELATGHDTQQSITANFAIIDAVRRHGELRRQRQQQPAERQQWQQQGQQEWQVIQQVRQQQVERRRQARKEQWARYRQRTARVRRWLIGRQQWLVEYQHRWLVRLRSFHAGLTRFCANFPGFEAVAVTGLRKVLVVVVGASVLVGLGVVGGALARVSREQETAMVWAPQATANAPVGRCIAASADWSPTNTRVRLADCRRPHWGEVLGYPRLAPPPTPFPVPYPGDDQVVALMRFHCGLLLSAQGLSPTTYDTSAVRPDSRTWNTRAAHSENYATCVVHHRDDVPLPSGQLVNPARDDHAPVRMSLYADTVAMNAPVHSCISDPRDFTASPFDVAVVPCDAMHVAEVIGYPTVFGPGTAWPGDVASLDAARAACGRIMMVPNDLRLEMLAPDRSRWAEPEWSQYATCTVMRVDGQPFRGDVLGDVP